MRHSIGRAWIVVILIATASGSANGQEARRPASDSASTMLQAQIQQLGSERAALQAENARLKEQLEKLEKASTAVAGEKEALARRAGSAESRVSRAEAGQQSTKARMEATEGRLSEVVAKYKELAEQLRTVETERNQFAQDSRRDAQSLQACAQKNVEMAGIANEALTRYEKKGCFGALAQAEPFTGIKRAQIENAVEEYRLRIDRAAIPAAGQISAQPPSP